MKAHVGVDSQSKVIHSVVVTPANTADCKVMDQLLLGHETRLYGDQAYKRQGQLIPARAPKAKDFTNRKNRTKSSIRARVEHSIGVIKRVFGFRKVRYRGLAKNGNRLFVTAAWPTFFWSATPCWEQSVRSRKVAKEGRDLPLKSAQKSIKSR